MLPLSSLLWVLSACIQSEKCIIEVLGGKTNANKWTKPKKTPKNPKQTTPPNKQAILFLPSQMYHSWSRGTNEEKEKMIHDTLVASLPHSESCFDFPSGRVENQHRNSTTYFSAKACLHFRSWVLVSSALCAMDLESKKFSDAKVKILAKKKRCIKLFSSGLLRTHFMTCLRMLSAFQYQTSSHALLNWFSMFVKDEWILSSLHIWGRVGPNWLAESCGRSR